MSDKIILAYATNGLYSPKLGYKRLSIVTHIEENTIIGGRASRKKNVHQNKNFSCGGRWKTKSQSRKDSKNESIWD